MLLYLPPLVDTKIRQHKLRRPKTAARLSQRGPHTGIAEPNNVEKLSRPQLRNKPWVILHTPALVVTEIR